LPALLDYVLTRPIVSAGMIAIELRITPRAAQDMVAELGLRETGTIPRLGSDVAESGCSRPRLDATSALDQYAAWSAFRLIKVDWMERGRRGRA